MVWNDGPLQSWYDVHEAIRRELIHLRALAAEPVEDGGAALTEAVQFFMDILTVHSMHEDGVVFPFMRRHGIEIPGRVREDHHQEWANVYDLRTALVEIHALDEGRDVDGAFGRIASGLEALEEDLLAHIDFEDGEIIPQCEARLSVEEQQAVIRKLGGETPRWIAPHLMPWMFANMRVEHAVQLLDTWHGFLPPEVFREKATAVREGVDSALWQAFVRALPDLKTIEGSSTDQP